MTTGTWSVTIDAYNKASKTWAGADGLKNQEHAYNVRITSFRNTKFQKWAYPYADRKKAPVYQGETYASPYHGSSLDEPGFSSKADFEAKVKLADQIRGHNWNAGVSLATLPQAVSQIRNAATAGLSMMIAIKRGDIGGATRALGRITGQSNVRLSQQAKRCLKANDVSGSYLALQYGILPTIADTYSAVEAIEAGFRSAKLSFKVAASDKIEVGWSGSNPVPLLRVPPQVHKKIVGLRAHVTSRPWYSDLTGLGILDPASVLWELTPWSFVVDWFVSVGDYLRTVNTLYGWGAEVWKSTFIKRECFHASKGRIYVSAYNDYEGGSTKRSVITVNRVLDSLEVELPPFNWAGPLNATRLRNAAALIHGLAGRTRH